MILELSQSSSFCGKWCNFHNIKAQVWRLDLIFKDSDLSSNLLALIRLEPFLSVLQISSFPTAFFYCYSPLAWEQLSTLIKCEGYLTLESKSSSLAAICNIFCSWLIIYIAKAECNHSIKRILFALETWEWNPSGICVPSHPKWVSSSRKYGKRRGIYQTLFSLMHKWNFKQFGYIFFCRITVIHFSIYSFTWICPISSCKFLIALGIVSDENICLLYSKRLWKHMCLY